MSALWETQKAVYGLITAALPTRPVFSLGGVPDNFEGSFIVIGDATGAGDDTDQTLGQQVTVTVHTWDFSSTARGMKNVKELMAEVYTVLNRAEFPVSGYTLTDCFFEFEQAMLDSDGLTPHGVQRFRILLTEI